MKKILAILVALLLILSMASPAYAATPSVGVPEVPQISDIKFDIKIELPDSFWDNWFQKNPIKIDWSAIYRRNNYGEE